ncbi:hypothetical protein SADUNF_Sadunf07G0113300 [Salix dunnii]|uniref:Uncharacterized protein n=1 Tax=Salix dunnii TaxID=1413687 RepID=A0A835K271_9ROSI|nr:hypothetical protein SADUNF_Sadunf07G0113200 [Salix dunnii]KAF9679180.1 hypothetical protein SADUNF_Sadunf07G0113300 [Salix dunnii]
MDSWQLGIGDDEVAGGILVAPILSPMASLFEVLSNRIDLEKPQYVFLFFGSSAGCSEIEIDGGSSGNPGCEVDNL